MENTTEPEVPVERSAESPAERQDNSENAHPSVGEPTQGVKDTISVRTPEIVQAKERVTVSWETVNLLVNDLASRAKDLHLKNIYGIPRGGLVVAVMLSHKLNLPVLLDRNLISSWTLIVDDIADTGKTMRMMRSRQMAKHCKAMALFAKPQGREVVDYAAENIPFGVWLDFPWEWRQ